MSQQPDPTIPFDASVVDEEALRALRAVQRSLPMGDGGASGNLVGGTEAVAAFGMVRGGPSDGIAVRPHEISPLEWNLAPAPQDEPLKSLDLAPQKPAITLDAAPSGVDLSLSAAPTPMIGPRANLARSSSSYLATEQDSSSAQVVFPVFADIPSNPIVVTPPTTLKPDPQEPDDILADSPAVFARDVVGMEDTGIGLDLSAALVDRDGSEVLTVSILGVPDGASLSHGSRQADGSWSVPASDLAHISFTPPQHFSGTIDLTLRATALESRGSSISMVETAFRVQVQAVADAPIVTVMDARGSEDTPVSLAGLGGALRDTDGSEALTFVLSGVPADATLSAGSRQLDGTWTLTLGELSGLTLTPPSNFSGRYNLTLTAIATESSNSSQARTSASFTVGFDPVADDATISGSSAGAEDTSIVIRPTFSLSDRDGSETWSEFSQVSGVPSGARLSHGSELSPGVWQVATADLQAGLVALHPAEHSDADFVLTIGATLTDSGNGVSVSREVTGTHAVSVTAVADAPQVGARDVAGQEDTPIALDLSASLTDSDGSETMVVSIFGIPDDFTLSAGTARGGGEWRMQAGDLQDLKLMPRADWHGTLNLTVQATSTEASSGGSATSSKSFTVTIDPVNDAPELTLTAAEHAESGAHQVEAIGMAHAGDIDSTQLGGGVITLSGAQPGDRLDLDGFTLHSEDGRTMIGDTGIELVGGTYAGETGTLTLSGHTSPETYAAVLQSLMLESGDPSGLAAGTRSIGVVLFDSEGAASTRQCVDVVVDEAEPVEAEGQGFVAIGSELAQNGAGSDIILMMADEETEMSQAIAGSWTEQIDSDQSSAASHSASTLDQPVADHIQTIDDLQVDASRMNWS